MRELVESEGDVNVLAAYALEPGRAHVRLSMVSSLDGLTTDREGWTNGLGGAPDLAVFRAVRATTDVVLVGAGTIRTGRMPALRGPQQPPPTLAVVTGSGDLDLTLPVFAQAPGRVLIVTTTGGDELLKTAGCAFHTIVVGEEAIDIGLAVSLLQNQYESPRVLCEGGSTLASALVDADLVDELCLTLAPELVGFETTRLLRTLASQRSMHLSSTYREGDTMLLRYTREVEN
jgi:riboflavin biosynthesis pyrimidine reductase